MRDTPHSHACTALALFLGVGSSDRDCTVVVHREARSTQVTGKAILAAAVQAVDEEAAQRVRDESKWRFKYNKHFVRSVELSCESPDAALAVRRRT